MNDEPTLMDPEEVFGMATTMLISEIFRVEQDRVARDIVRLRERVAS
jgi:hypothetical protein